MPALSNDFKSRFLQSANSFEVWDPWNTGHSSDGDFDCAYIRASKCSLSGVQVLLNRTLNIIDRILFCFTL